MHRGIKRASRLQYTKDDMHELAHRCAQTAAGGRVIFFIVDHFAKPPGD
jgi:hypothetical protein